MNKTSLRVYNRQFIFSCMKNPYPFPDSKTASNRMRVLCVCPYTMICTIGDYNECHLQPGDIIHVNKA